MGPVESELRKVAAHWMTCNGTKFYGFEAYSWLVVPENWDAVQLIIGCGARFAPPSPYLADAWSEAIEAAEALNL